MTSDGDLARLLAQTNPWWKPDRVGTWERDDPDLQKAAHAPFSYEPDALVDVTPDGLYMLLGPRRVGKSVEIKRTISRLINHQKLDPRRIIHFACDGLSRDDIQRLVRVARRQLTRNVVDPRYWFLDEITGAEKGWPGAIKYLRDNDSGFGSDCVVLTGSSSRDLNEARKALAGRRGRTSRTERYLLPMTFRQFARILGVTAPELEPVPARRWVTDEAADAVNGLLPYLDELLNAWEAYCTVGGYPRALEDFLTEGEVGAGFLQDVWDVIHGDALGRSGSAVTPTQTDLLLSGLASRLTQPVNLGALATEVGYAAGHTASARLDSLEMAYLLWRCYPSREGRWFPVEGSQYKAYFMDPLLARMATVRRGGGFAPAASAITEQQLGLHLLRQHEAERPGTFSSYTELLSMKTPSEKEIDFAGAWTDGIAFEGKYVDERVPRESLTAKSQVAGGVLRAAVLATRGFVSFTEPVWAIPAPVIVWLLAE